MGGQEWTRGIVTADLGEVLILFYFPLVSRSVSLPHLDC